MRLRLSVALLRRVGRVLSDPPEKPGPQDPAYAHVRTALVSTALLLVLSAAPLLAAGLERPVIDAVKHGNQEALRALVKRHADVNVPEPDGTRAIHWAVRANDVESVKLLLGAGATVNVSNRYGVTPLALVATSGNQALADMLLEAGASADSALPEGETVLMTAARAGHAAIVRALLAHGATVDARESWFGETALMWAAAENHADAVRTLVQFGANVNARSAPTKFPELTWKTEGMATTVFPRGGWTPLMYAARQGAVESARALAAAGADLNLTDPDGTTALVLAIINAHNDVAALLLEKGANPNIADSTGMAALYAAIDTSAVEWLHNRPVPKPSGELQSLDIVKALLAHGADPNARLKSPVLQKHHTTGEGGLGEGTTPLMRAARATAVPVMRALIDAGADATLKQKNQTTALLLAAGLLRDGGLSRVPWSPADAVAAAELLLENGADIKAANADGQTVLHAAAGRGESVSGLIQFLVDRGADVHARNQRDQTALDVANRTGETGIRRPRADPATVALLSRLLGVSPSADGGQPR